MLADLHIPLTQFARWHADEDHCTIRWAGSMAADASLDEAGVGRALEVALGNMTSGIIAVVKGAAPDFARQPNEDWQLQRSRGSSPGRSRD